MLILFQDPTGNSELGESAVEAITPGQQERLRRLLGVETYSRRWPHIPATELRASAVEHPYCTGGHLLLVGMEGHRSQVRPLGHAASWHYMVRRTCS